MGDYHTVGAQQDRAKTWQLLERIASALETIATPDIVDCGDGSDLEEIGPGFDMPQRGIWRNFMAEGNPQQVVWVLWEFDDDEGNVMRGIYATEQGALAAENKLIQHPHEGREYEIFSTPVEP